MDSIISEYQPITLEEMSSIKLMNRIDTKFLTTLPRLELLLKMAGAEYRVQETGGERNMLYDTTYFDTPVYDMYNMHQTGHANRQKIRFRTYVSSNLQFMEVKTKNNHGRTKKKRMEVSDMDLSVEEKRVFLAKHLRYDVDTLQPALNSLFRRITLVNRAKTERLTIDTSLCFRHLQTGGERQLPNLVIIELKRDGLCPSPVLSMLRELRIHPHGFSKYCMGSAMTNSDLRVNLFKTKLIDVRKILQAAV